MADDSVIHFMAAHVVSPVLDDDWLWQKKLANKAG
jgi:hypothetical protein